MLGLLEIVIGLIFILLLLSLLAMTVMELIASVFTLRGKNLEAALKNMLASADESEQILNAFKDNSLYRQVSQPYGKESLRPPSYLSSESFQSILFDVILKGDKIEHLMARIETLPDTDLKNVLKQFLTDADYELDAFKGRIRTWYNDVMDRASGWYKRSVQYIIVFVGMAIAVTFNADTIAIYERLESNPDELQQVVELAMGFMKENPNLSARDYRNIEEQSREVQRLIGEEIEHVKSPLGLGWSNVSWGEMQFADWMLKILGWVVTALAISMGAPFWFDLLQSLINIRGAGNVPIT